MNPTDKKPKPLDVENFDDYEGDFPEGQGYE